MQWWSAPDLRVEVSAGDSYGSTTMKENTTDPTFDETVLLWPERPLAPHAPAPALNVNVYDADCFGADKLGTGSVALGTGWRKDTHRTETVQPPPPLCCCGVCTYSGTRVYGATWVGHA